MSTKRGVGVEGSLGAQAISELAALAETSGYGSFWFNVLGSGNEPVEALRRALAATRTIEIGIGVFPLDAYPAADIAPKLADAGISTRRAIIGIATGQIRKNALQLTTEAIETLRAAVPEARIATGGYGPKMLELGGRLADVFLANWLTLPRLDDFIAEVAAGAARAGRARPEICLYHRAARGPDAVQRLSAELAEYRRYPVHEKHQATMGNPAFIGVAASAPGEIAAQIAEYESRCNVVLKPLPRAAGDLDEWRALVSFFAPTK